MPIDDLQFGRLLQTVESMTNSVNTLSARVERGFEQMSNAFSTHEKEDAKVANKVADLEEWRDGNGKKNGAEDAINDLVVSKTKFIAFFTGVAMMSGALGSKILTLLEKIL